MLDQFRRTVQQIDRHQPVGQLADDLVALGTRRRQFAVVVIKRQRRQRRQRLGAAIEEQLGEFVAHLLGQQRHFRRFREILDQLAEDRSEEHTSELQTLMRISYAVFCLKKKKTTQN